MRFSKLLTIVSVFAGLAATANAQFSVSGAGSPIPGSAGSGGVGATYPTALPAGPATSTVNVPVGVTSIDSIVVDGFEHTWAGDLQMTLSDPAGTEHLIFLRPGFLNPSNFGTAGNFMGGQYTFVESGGLSLPTSSNGNDIPPATYNQTFDSGGTVWNSGDHGIVNTPLSSISGAMGDWTLRIYDWASGDMGTFTGWTLNGNGNGGPNSGTGYCFGDGTGAACPCGGFGAAGEGCVTTSGVGATLMGTGNADTGNDTFTLSITGGPANKAGLFFQGTIVLGNFAGDGILCTNANLRYDLNALDGNGETSQTAFGLNANPGDTLNYQYWFRDPGNPCGGLFNFSGGWTATWN